MIVSLGALALAGCGGGGSSSNSTDTGLGLNKVTCATFTYQKDAQLYYLANKESSAAALDPDGNGQACESLPSNSTTVPLPAADTPAVVPSGLWAGSMSNGDLIRGVVFPPPADNPTKALTGEAWFMRMQPKPYGTLFPTWLAYGGTGTAAVNGVFNVKGAQVLRVTDFGAGQSTVIDWTATVTPATSMLGSWTQSDEKIAFQASYQATQLPIPSIAAMAGHYADAKLATTATTTAETAALPFLTVYGDGGLVGQINTGCTFDGRMYQSGTSDPAFRVVIWTKVKDTCPRQVTYGEGIAMFDKVSGQLYMIAQDTLGAALLFAGTKQ